MEITDLSLMESKIVNIVILGSRGQVGYELSHLSWSTKYNVTSLDSSQLDITDPTSVQRLETYDPDFIVNCAAYTAVDQAETDVGLCAAVNSSGPGFLGAFCKNHDAYLFHFSTDYVYHGDGPKAYSEDSPTNPKSIYAKTKLNGEEKIVTSECKHIILRTSWVYASRGSNFVLTMMRLARSRDSLKIVNDQIGAPTWARDIAYAVLDIIETANNDLNRDYTGIYNFSNEATISWHEFALKIFEIRQLDIDAQPIPTSEYPTLALRPLWSVMSMDKITDTFNIKARPWAESLMKCLDELPD